MDSPTSKPRYHSIGRWGCGRVRAIDLIARDIAYLDKLFIHGVLSNATLHALVNPDKRQRFTTERLFLLRNLPNEYVTQPKAQENAKNANYATLAYEITEKGVAALVDSGRISYGEYVLWRKRQANCKYHHFDHDLVTGYILASIELGARQVGIRFISWREILNRSKCPAETREAPNPFAIPYQGDDGRRCIIPDALFGLEYKNGACFFALETDMGSEQLRESELKNATIAQKLRGYRKLIQAGVYRSRFGLPSLQILTVTNSNVRMQNMLHVLTRIAGGAADASTRPFLFKAVPELALRSGAPLGITGHLLTAPWRRANQPDCDIARL